MKILIALFLLVWLGASGQISPSSAALRGTDFTLFDSFQRANVVGSLGVGPYGVPWDIRGKSTGVYPIPAGTNAYLQGTLFKTTPPVGASNGATYIVHQFSNTVSRIGARVNWTTGNTPGGSEATLAILISTNSNLISDMVHWIVYRTAWDLQIRVADGVFQTIYHGTMSVPTNGLSHIYEMSVNNDTVTLNVDGEIFSFNDSRVSALIGPYAVWEHYYNDNAYNSRLNIEAVWAGATPVGAWSGNVFSSANGNSSIGYTNAVPADPAYTWDVNGVLALSSGAFATRQGANNVIFTGTAGLAVVDDGGATTLWTFSQGVPGLQSFGTGSISTSSGDLDIQSGGNDTDIGGLLKLGGSAFANKTGGNNILYTGTAGLAVVDDGGATTLWTFSEGVPGLQSNGAGSLSTSAGDLSIQSGGNRTVFGGLLNINGGATPAPAAFGDTSSDNNAWAASRGALTFYDGTAATFLVGALVSDVPSNGQVPTWNTGGTITWETPSAGGGASLDAITADAASSAIQNGAFTNEWRWTDAGAGAASFTIKGTNSTASTLFTVRGQMTSATAILANFTETTASTGGNSSQYLANFETLAGSTANPWRVATRGNLIAKASHNSTQMIFTDGSDSIPIIGFESLATAGLLYASGPQLQYNSTHYFKATSSAVSGLSSSSFNLTTSGFTATAGGQVLNVINTGNSSNPGLGYNARVLTSSSGTVTLTTSVDGTTSLGSGTIHNCTGTVTYALPATPTIGDNYTIYVNTANAVTIDPAGASQQLRIGAGITTASTGTATATAQQGTSITFVYVSANLWVATSFIAADWVVI